MFDQLQQRWVYASVVSASLGELLDEGLLCEQRATRLRADFEDAGRLDASLASIATGRVENAAMAFACDCALLYQEASARGEDDSGDYLKLSARAMMLAEMPDPFIRVRLSELRASTGRDAHNTVSQAGTY